MTERTLVKCEDCESWIKPVGNNRACVPGECRSFNTGLATNPGKMAMQRAYLVRGNCGLWVQRLDIADYFRAK